MCKIMEELRAESYAEGLKEGSEKQARDTAVRMSKKGHSVEDIAESVGFSVNIVRQWLTAEI